MPDKQFRAEHNDAFHADAITIMHGKGSFILDFKDTTPRFDQVDDDSQHTLITEHDAVVIQPQMAKILLNLLEDNVQEYEEKFGEITVPEQQPGSDETADSHTYIG